jgi:hypothetical protein
MGDAMSDTEPTGEDVAGLHLDIQPGHEPIFPGWPARDPYISIQGDAPDCFIALDVQEARDVAASLLRAADVLEAHLTGEAQ